MESLENKIELNKSEAIAKIKIITEQVFQLGFNDYEIPDLKNILKMVINDEMDPKEGLRLATQILDSKQDYH